MQGDSSKIVGNILPGPADMDQCRESIHEGIYRSQSFHRQNNLLPELKSKADIPIYGPAYTRHHFSISTSGFRTSSAANSKQTVSPWARILMTGAWQNTNRNRASRSCCTRNSGIFCRSEEGIPRRSAFSGLRNHISCSSIKNHIPVS